MPRGQRPTFRLSTLCLVVCLLALVAKIAALWQGDASATLAFAGLCDALIFLFAAIGVVGATVLYARSRRLQHAVEGVLLLGFLALLAVVG